MTNSSDDICLICGDAMAPLQTIRVVMFNGKPARLHQRCWHEQQDAIKMLEKAYPGLSLYEALRKSKEGKLA